MGLESYAENAPGILMDFIQPDIVREHGITKEQWARACGFVVMRVYKLGCIVTLRGGKGMVVARLPDGSYSAPAALQYGGPGVGADIGIQSTETVLLLNTPRSVESFYSSTGGVSLAASLTIAQGREGETGIIGGEAITTFSRTAGVYGGVSLEFAGFKEATNVNIDQYGPANSSPRDILTGKVPRPKGRVFDTLYDTLAVIDGRLLHGEAKDAPSAAAPAAAAAAAPPQHQRPVSPTTARGGSPPPARPPPYTGAKH